jgi:hypothetical protein
METDHLCMTKNNISKYQEKLQLLWSITIIAAAAAVVITIILFYLI